MAITKLGAGAERAVECHMRQEASPPATRVPGDDLLGGHHMAGWYSGDDDEHGQETW